MHNIALDAREVAPAIRLRGRNTACENLREVKDAGLHTHFGQHLAETDRFLSDHDQQAFYVRLESTVEAGVRNAASEQLIMDEDGTLLRDKVRIR